MAKKCIGIDLGSGNLTVYEEGRGIVSKEPSVAAVSTSEKEGYINSGRQAYIVAEKRPGAVRLVRPVKEGKIVDFDIAVKMLNDALEGLSLKSFDAVVSVHAGLDESEKSKFADLARAVGADSTALVNASTAAVVGAELDISDKNCLMVCDIGYGVTEISVVGGIVGRYAKLLPYGGESLDNAVVTEVKKEYAVTLSSEDAKMLRETHCTPSDEDTEAVNVTVTGLNIITGLPMETEVEPDLVYDSVYEISDYIAENAKYVLDGVGADIAAQIGSRGILLCGGASLTPGIAELIADKTGVAVIPATKPMNCVAEGLGAMIENMDVFGVILDFGE